MFKKAEKMQAKLKIGLSGPSGSGKTYSALLIAKGIGGKVAVLDTENKSASLYADKFEFDTSPIEPPFATEKYSRGIDEAVKAGYDILIIDSISHQWSQLLDDKNQVDARGGNSFANWSKFTPKHNAFIQSILQADIHIICTMRSKQDYIMQANNSGKQAPVKVGLAPITRDGFEYELTCSFDIAINHEAVNAKDRTGLFDDRAFKIVEETGQDLICWMKSGKELVVSPLYDECLKQVGLIENEKNRIGFSARVEELMYDHEGLEKASVIIEKTIAIEQNNRETENFIK